MKYGRNSPCPCGSGKKYKHCCLKRQDNPFSESPTQGLLDEVMDAVKEQDFTSMDELNAHTAQIANRRNTMAHEDFCGLSPEDMNHFLYSPFESPALISFSEDKSAQPESRVMGLFLAMVDAMGEAGLKATAKGNLPLKFCKETAEMFMEKKGLSLSRRFRSIRTETDYDELHCTRLTAELAGLIRKHKGKFVLTNKCKQMLSKKDEGKIYFELFRSYVTKFNWGYRDGYPEIDIFQMSFLFTLFLLQKFGSTSQPQSFYEDRFIQAFPMACQMMPESSYSTPENDVRHCYFLRVFERFADFFGLIELEIASKKPHERNYNVKKSFSLDKFVVFHLDHVDSSLH